MTYEKQTLLSIQNHADELADIVDGKSSETLNGFWARIEAIDWRQLVYFLVEKRGCDLGWEETLKLLGPDNSGVTFGWNYRDVEVGNLVWPQEGPITTSEQMFLANNTITSLHINKSDFKMIYNGAFCGCHNLKSVKIDSCSRIYPLAFSGCESLQEVILPDGLRNLERECFAGCTNLKVLEIPQSIRWIEKDIIGIYKGTYIGAGKTKIKIRGLNQEDGRAFVNQYVGFETANAKARILSKII